MKLHCLRAAQVFKRLAAFGDFLLRAERGFDVAMDRLDLVQKFAVREKSRAGSREWRARPRRSAPPASLFAWVRAR
jgi:hypothetical protein